MRRPSPVTCACARPPARSYDTEGEQLFRAIDSATNVGSGWHGARELAGPTHFTCRFGKKPAAVTAATYAGCRNSVGDAFTVAATPANSWKRGTFAASNDMTSTPATTCGSLDHWRPMSRCDRIVTWAGTTGATVTSTYYSSAMMMPKSDHNAILGAFTLSVPRPASLRFAAATPAASDSTSSGDDSSTRSIAADGIEDNDDGDDDGSSQ